MLYHPSSTEMERKIRSLLDAFRTDLSWYNVIHDLEAIGLPAVPFVLDEAEKAKPESYLRQWCLEVLTDFVKRDLLSIAQLNRYRVLITT